MTEAETLRSRLARKPIVVAPGVYDPFTALIASQAGFTTLYVSGAAIAYTKLGRPDIGLVTMTEVTDTLALIRDRVDSHLIVDADTGYGNALNVVRTVREFERAGANAIQLADHFCREATLRVEARIAECTTGEKVHVVGTRCGHRANDLSIRIDDEHRERRGIDEQRGVAAIGE
jgi:2-methylisocitrate lyase-like PEP mutase family enzyme